MRRYREDDKKLNGEGIGRLCGGILVSFMVEKFVSFNVEEVVGFKVEKSKINL